MDPATKFLKFLSDQGIENVSKFEDNIMDLVSDNYDSLTSQTMRAMVDCALAERDINVGASGKEDDLLGSWGIIIDTFKEQTMLRRERAGENMQQMVAFGLQSSDGSAVQAFIESLRKKNQIDSVLIDLVESSLADVDKYPGNDHIKNVLRDIFQRIKLRAPTATATAINDEISEEDLIAAGNELRIMVQSNSGDANKLKVDVLERMRGGSSLSSVSLLGPAFQKVLKDNITACRDVGYTNKTKFLEFLQHTIETTKTNMAKEAIAKTEEKPTNFSSLNDHINHAPQFVDESRSEVQVTLVEEGDTYIDITNAAEALSISATGSYNSGGGGGSKTINKKKKNLKSATKKKVGDMAASVGAHLEEHGWAVCDHAIPMELVKRVRIEAGLFTDFYEQSEIWVGKKSDIGAQLSVPSVRGDKVLWMCGGHKAVEGITRNVKTSGEVEPCRLDVKAQAPIRKFQAMKDLTNTIDCLVYEMKKKCGSLSGLFERSDAMLAIYPGDGARFARHIDNTTKDGRRLTVLAYLNPTWTPEQGGSLRLFTNDKDNGSYYKGDCTKDHSNVDDETDKKEGTEDKDSKEEGRGNGMHAIDVAPLGGRLAMFYSADIPHEVLPTFGMRHSITLWYYDKQERQRAVDESKESGSSQAVAESSVEAQISAKEFIGELMGGNEVEEDGGLPSEEELQGLSKRLKSLDDETVKIISSITGAPSADSFREGFPLLSVEDLRQMRGLFRRMGLNAYNVA